VNFCIGVTPKGLAREHDDGRGNRVEASMSIRIALSRCLGFWQQTGAVVDLNGLNFHSGPMNQAKPLAPILQNPTMFLAGSGVVKSAEAVTSPKMNSYACTGVRAHVR
jgi:hypothetical protein